MEEHPSQSQECIIVADSDVLVRHAISDYLRYCGYKVFEAASSDEARTILGEASVSVSAVLCDAQIAGSLNGFQLRAWMRENFSAVAIVLAGNVTTAANAAAEMCDEGPHLARPYDPQGVVDYINRLLGTSGRSVRQ
jgi:DNA-binding NtrC family response regulator